MVRMGEDSKPNQILEAREREKEQEENPG
jgi:hypothetical protein